MVNSQEKRNCMSSIINDDEESFEMTVEQFSVVKEF